MINRLKSFNYSLLIVLLNLFVIISILLTSVFLYKSDTFMFKAVDLFDEKTQRAIQLGEKRNSLMKFVDEFDIFSSQALNIGQIPDVPVLDIKLDQKNIDYINSVIARSIDQSSNVYTMGPFISIYDNNFVEDTETTILFAGKEFDAKIKLHGIDQDNWINPKKSFSIKTAKDDFINNTRRFKLIIFEEQFIETIFAYRLANLMDYINVGNEIVRVRFNGIDQGYYFLEETLSKDLLEKNKLSGVDLIKAHDEWTHQYKSGHLTLFSHEISNQEYKNYSEKDVGQLLLFKKLIEAETYEEVKDLVDLEKFAIHEAMRIVFGSDQGISGDNIKWLFDTTKGNFFPYFRMEGYLIDLPSSERSYTFDRDLNEWFWFDYDIKIFPILNKNNEFRALRNKYLYKILVERDNLEKYYSDLYDKFGLLISLDATNNYPSRWYLNKTKESISALSNNFDYIDKYLNYAKVYTTLTQINNKEFILEIVPDSNAIISIDKLEINGIDKSQPVEISELGMGQPIYELSTLEEYFKNKNFSLSLDDLLEVKKNVYRYRLRVKDNLNIDSYDISFINSITGNSVLKRETYKKFINTPKKLNISSENHFDVNKLLKKYPLLTIHNNSLIFNKGIYLIDEDVNIPKLFDVRFEPGSELLISQGISVLIRGNLDILGTKGQPVKISNIDPNIPFGVFAAVGTGDTRVNISGLDLTGGSEDSMSGIFLSGALSLYHHKQVTLSNSNIYKNYADDGVNIKNSQVIIENNLLSSNFFDQIDLDYTTGIVVNNNFEALLPQNLSSLNDDFNNGDGLDLSGSNLIIKNNSFNNFPDKGISIGENSRTIIIDNLFNKNRSALTIKDESEGYLYSNQYNLNKVDIEMYQKKQIFKHPSLYNLNDESKNYEILKTPSSHFFNLDGVIDSEMIKTFKDSSEINELFDVLNKLKWVEYE